MNGRVYDPILGRFISADPIVQAPNFSQSYNRYAYVWNNPVSMIDPSGFEGTPIENITIWGTNPSSGVSLLIFIFLVLVMLIALAVENGFGLLVD